MNRLFRYRAATSIVQPRCAWLIGVWAALTVTAAASARAEDSLLVPILESKWRQIAPNAPDVGALRTGEENACDFALFQAKDASWRCISCIRGTTAPGQRLFYQWKSDKITDSNWQPVGLLDVERGQRGTPPEPTSVQAPHPLIWEGKWYLFYNSAGARCLVSDDGIHWHQHKNAAAETRFFDMGRDVCVFRDEPAKRWIAYYCGTVSGPEGKRGAMVARTALKLEGPWSKEETAVRTTGNPESPFVVRHEGKYYLWQQMAVYASDDPLQFNDAPLVAHLTGLWFDGKFAPEIVEKDGQWYVAGYSRGIHVAKFKWQRKTLADIAAWQEKWRAYLREEEQKRRQREEARKKAATAKPNFIFILCDNLGYGDVGCFGSTKHRTPALDGMAREGLRLMSFYSASGVCTASRASLMTGCYPRRVNLHISDTAASVLFPGSPKGLHPDEITIAELLRTQGYATACIGKWHLGDQPPFLPTRQGFDYYLGIPYSEDMVENPKRGSPPLPLMEGEKVIEAPVDPNQLTQRYTKRALQFITENRESPFFLYLAHATPGSARESYASARFRGKSANGTYGDAVEEMDWSTGEIQGHLKKLGIDQRTLVVWTADNGAVEGHGGSCAPLKGWGYTTSEGGMRMPCIVRWPGTIPAGRTCDEVCSMMDWLPTFARWAGGREPTDRIIDGKDIRLLLLGDPAARSPYEAFYFYQVEQLQAVRSGRWKLYLPLENKRKGPNWPGGKFPGALYDLDADIGETTNLIDDRPDVVTHLLEFAAAARADLGDSGRDGKGQRPAGWFDSAKPPRLVP